MQMTSFAERLIAFNDMYRLPISLSPTLSWAHASKHPRGNNTEIPSSVQVHEDWAVQVNNFFNILREELGELDDLQEMFDSESESDEFDILTAIADWLSDIAVYSMSEATKYGVADYVPNFIYTDHASLGVAYSELDQMESAIMSVGEGLTKLVDYHETLLVGQPSAKNMAKFLSALIARCFHEAEHFGFNLYDTLEIVMDSNMSKLGEDGNPIYDERGKVKKGPGYWKPEPKIREYITSLFELDDSEDEELEDDEEDEDEGDLLPDDDDQDPVTR